MTPYSDSMVGKPPQMRPWVRPLLPVAVGVVVGMWVDEYQIVPVWYCVW